jgi:hypothetical protein
LREEKDLPSVDGGASRDDAVAQEFPLAKSERARPVNGEHVELDERAGIDERLDAFASGALPACVLPFVGRFTCRRERPRAAFAECFDCRFARGLLGFGHYQIPRCTLASSLAIVRGSHGGVKVISTLADLTPSMPSTLESTACLNIGPTGHMGEVSVMVTLTFSFSGPSTSTP